MMIEFILAPQNYPFTISLAVLLIIAMLEGVGAVMGAGLSDIVDQLLPSTEIDLDFEAPDIDSPTNLEWALSWFRVRRVPVLVLLVIFLLIYGMIGLIIQNIVLSTFGYLLPALVAGGVALIPTLPTTKVLSSALAKILPKDETSAVSHRSLIGRTAEVTLGVAKQNYPAQAKTKDQFGKVHYLMVEPDCPDITFKKGDSVLLVKYENAKFYGIAPTFE